MDNTQYDNVYDAISDFYAQDEFSWNSIIKQEYIEDFLRRETWNGKTNKELFYIWNDLTRLLLYLICSDNTIYAMNKECFIDCVA